MVDLANPAAATLIVKCLFIATVLGAFGGTVKKVDPVIAVPVTRVIEGEDGKLYEVGYDITATQTGLRGQPRLSVWGYNVQGQKADLTVPEVIRSKFG
jgi:hypothetical protein